MYICCYYLRDPEVYTTLVIKCGILKILLKYRRRSCDRVERVDRYLHACERYLCAYELGRSSGMVVV